MVCTGYPAAFDPAAQQGLLTRNALGQPYLYRYTGSTQFMVGQFDFSQPAARAYYGGLLKEAVDDGYDGWMEDFGEYTPTDAQSSDGTPGPAMHNRYPRLYHRAARTFTKSERRPMARFNRSGWTGAAKESQIVWGGDPTTDWGYDGLQSAVRQALTMGLSGVSIWGSDTGGYFTIGNTPQLTPELLKRWIEFAFASGVMRTEANGTAIPDHGERPQIFDSDVLPIWRRYAKLRTQLYPYVDAADTEDQRDGMPIMRALALMVPGDARAAGIDDEYMFGPDLLVAPVLSPGASKRSLYVPHGRWIDLWRAASFVSKPGTLRLRKKQPATIDGGRSLTLPAPLEQLPVLVRAGALLPLLPADTGSLVGLKKKPYRLLAFPAGRSTARVGTMKLVSTLKGSKWTLVVTGARRDTIDVEAALPCGIYKKRLALRSRGRLQATGCRG
jgi:alpha-glucosidase (family GH31 glycosyl hydrolase)